MSRFDDWAWNKTGLPVGEMSRHDAVRAAFDGGYRLADSEREHDIAHAYWRGMLARDIADAEREARKLAADEAVKVRLSPTAPGGLFVLGPAYYERRAARLRAIAESEMWLPWWERRKAGAP